MLRAGDGPCGPPPFFIFAGKPRRSSGPDPRISPEDTPSRARKAFPENTSLFIFNAGSAAASPISMRQDLPGRDRTGTRVPALDFSPSCDGLVLRPRSTSISSFPRRPGSEGKPVMQYHSAVPHGSSGECPGSFFCPARLSVVFGSPLPGGVLRGRPSRLCRAVCASSIASEIQRPQGFPGRFPRGKGDFFCKGERIVRLLPERRTKRSENAALFTKNSLYLPPHSRYNPFTGENLRRRKSQGR